MLELVRLQNESLGAKYESLGAKNESKSGEVWACSVGTLIVQLKDLIVNPLKTRVLCDITSRCVANAGGR
jgi:hypothetical protein